MSKNSWVINFSGGTRNFNGGDSISSKVSNLVLSLWGCAVLFLSQYAARFCCSETKDSIIYLPHFAYATAKLLQSCPTLCDPIDGSPPGSPIPGILQARILEWVAISFSNAYKWKVKVKLLSRVRLLATPWTAAYQAPPSMGYSRQEYWSGVPLPSPKKGTII